MKAKKIPISYLIEIEKGRFREEHGLFYEDFVVGINIEHRPGRTITETDNIWQSLINMNTHPLHIDRNYAAGTEFKQNLVSSLLLVSIVGGLSLASTSARGIANLGWKNIELLAPVYVGDTVYAETKILSKRLSKSRKGQGIVTVETKGIKAEGTVFLKWERAFLVHRGEQ
jgi:itaconyl-CoA hydratase